LITTEAAEHAEVVLIRHHRRPAAPDGAGVTGDRRDPKTDTSFDPGFQIPAIVRHTSLAKPGCRSLRWSNDTPSRVASSAVLMSVHGVAMR